MDPSAPFRTLRPKDLLEMPDFVRHLSDSYARDESLHFELRKQLGRLSAFMAQAIDLSYMQEPANGNDAAKKSDGMPISSRVLHF